MEIKGEEFIKKVHLQQEREELEQKLNELEDSEPLIGENSTILNETNSNKLEDTQLENIMLEEPKRKEEDNKKKYLILGLLLIILFLFTIIVIRLLSNDSKEDSFTSNNTDPIETIASTEESNIEENFQKIMNERIKKDSNEIKEDKDDFEERINGIKEVSNQEENNEKISESLVDETIKKIEAKVTPKEISKEVPKAVVEKVKEVKKVIPKKSVEALVNNISSSAPSGYFVQIGAFSKKPTPAYISKIRNANFKYKVHQVNVKGKLFNKVLIGPYSSRATASSQIENIKAKLKLNSAYVLKF